MRILVLGGTVFVGRHVVEAALARGHEVTLFNRGVHSPDLFPGVERLRGDRDGGLGALAGRSWDAVVDTCGYFPRVVVASADALADSGRYLFVSSISAYADLSRPGLREDAALAGLDDETVEEVNGDTYGGLKALCERAVERRFGDRAVVVRPGLIVGPHDPTGRFTYWVRRVAEGGVVLAPGRPDRVIQAIDARDLAAFTVGLLERGESGAFNAVGPNEPLTMAELLDACRRVSGSDARIVWVDDQTLLDAGVEPWTELPLWIPESDADHAGFVSVDAGRARAAGLTTRPIEDTVRDTLHWARTAAPPEPREVDASPSQVGLVPEREAELLAGARA